MKLHIELDASATDCEITIRAREMNAEVQRLEKALRDAAASVRPMTFYKGEAEHFFPVSEVLFFETDEEGLFAHTANDVFTVRYRLYELEALLPSDFLRVSKSAILNTRMVSSIVKNLTAASLVTFRGSHKKIYVSRHYYKALKMKLGVG